MLESRFPLLSVDAAFGMKPKMDATVHTHFWKDGKGVYPKQRRSFLRRNENSSVSKYSTVKERILLIFSTPRDPYVLLGLQCITDIVLE
jgi:hypothetical protein